MARTVSSDSADSPFRNLQDDLIVCTYRRPTELIACLASVARQTHIPATVTVVEGQSNLPTVWPDHLKASLGERLRHFVVPPGLTRQRNYGVSVTGGEIVHFIDDDVVLEENYFEALLETFAEDSARRVGGVGGVVTNLPASRHSPLRKIMLLDGPQGSLLRSGKSILVRDAGHPVDVDWLSGATMSFRRDVLETFAFDESRSTYEGEDAEFTARVGLTYRLIVNPAARLEHRQSPVGRLDEEASVRTELAHRYNLARRRIGRARPFWFWYSVVGEAMLLAGLALKERSRAPLGRAARLIAGARSVRNEYAGRN